MTSPNSNRLAELDALRGVAVLLVLIYHYTTRFGELFPPWASGLGFPLGAYGVHLFFVISGFVIIMTLDRSAHAADFLVARFSRLYPAYWTAIVVTTLALWLFDGPLETLPARQVAANFSMVQGFFHVPSVDGVYWTLQVELFFYAAALAVFCAGLLARAEVLALGWLGLSALFFSPAWKAVSQLPIASLMATLLNLEFAPFFVIGMMFYRIYKSRGKPAWNYAMAGTAYGLILLTQPLMVTLLIGAGSGVIAMLSRGGWRAMRTRPLIFLGAISYSLYLVHQKIGYALIYSLREHGWRPAAAIVAAAALSIALATLLTYLVERPAMRAIRQWYKAWKQRGPRAVRPSGMLRQLLRLRYSAN